MSESEARPVKRVKLDSDDETKDADYEDDAEDAAENLDDQCSICLSSYQDRTLLPACSHEFCFDCILVWSEQSRRCPLCTAQIGEYLIHKFRSRYDYEKRYLPPLVSKSPKPLQPMSITGRRVQQPRRRLERHWGRRDTDEADRLDRSIRRRKWIYEHHLYAKHVASNSHTRFRPYPAPSLFAASPDLIARTTTFLRRELRVWNDLDIEFLTTFIISIMKSIDIRSESAVKLLSEFLDLDRPYVEGVRIPNAEHFAHEVYTYVRSPYKDLFVYDSVIQYDVTPPSSQTDSPYPPEASTSRRTPSPAGRSRYHSRSPSPRREERSPSWVHSRRLETSHQSSHRQRRSPSLHSDVSWSPSGRFYPSVSERPRSPSVSSSRKHSRRDSDLQHDRRDKGKGKAKENIEDDDDDAEAWVPKMPPAINSSASVQPELPSRDGERPVTPDRSEAPLEEIHPLLPAPRERERKPLRPPRQATLSDSIRGHLSTQSRPLSDAKLSMQASRPSRLRGSTPETPAALGDEVDGAPALSERMTNGAEPHRESHGLSIRGASKQVLRILSEHKEPATPIADSSNPSSPSPETLPPSSSSVPSTPLTPLGDSTRQDLMERTRARLEKLKKEGVKPDEVIPKSHAIESREHLLQKLEEEKHEARGNSKEGRPRSSLDGESRDKLLRRLDEERKAGGNNASHVPSSSSLASKEGQGHEELASLEANLKSKAKLKMRLAAEKRKLPET